MGKKISLYIKRLFKYVIGGEPKKIITADIKYLSPANRLKDRKLVITGGSRGIGLAMARKFVEEGASVLITGRDADVLKAVSQEIGCEYLVLDLLDIDSFDGFLDNAEKKLGQIDGLVNNAGVSLHEKSFFDITKETFDLQIDTNFRGPLFLTQAFVRRLKERNLPGNILFVSSETGITMDIRPYGYTKAAINSMVQGLAYSLAKDGIRVNAVAPGITATEMTGFNQNENLYLKKNMTERVYLPGEVAETACFLLSDASSCISGQILVCNNGRTINSRVKK